MSDNQELPEVGSRKYLQLFVNEIAERAKNAHPMALEVRKPEVAAKALWMLAQGESKKEVSRVTGLCREAIRNLIFRNSDTLESRREEIARRYMMAAYDATDLVFKKMDSLDEDDEALEKTPIKDLALVTAIYTDKASQLSGMPTSTVEHKIGHSLEDAQEAIRAAQAAIAKKTKGKVIDAEEA